MTLYPGNSCPRPNCPGVILAGPPMTCTFCDFVDSPAPHPGAVSVDTGEAGGGEGVDVPPLPTEPDSPTATQALEAAKELAEENATLKLELRTARKFLESERRRANEAEDNLAEVQWLCSALGFQGAADTEDLLQWLLGVLGYPRLAAALVKRRRLLAEIGQKEAALNQLAARLHWRVPPDTDNRCKCGNEARKLEGEDGFTTCDSCYQDGEE